MKLNEFSPCQEFQHLLGINKAQKSKQKQKSHEENCYSHYPAVVVANPGSFYKSVKTTLNLVLRCKFDNYFVRASNPENIIPHGLFPITSERNRKLAIGEPSSHLLPRLAYLFLL